MMSFSGSTRVKGYFSYGGGEGVLSPVRILLAPLCGHCLDRTFPLHTRFHQSVYRGVLGRMLGRTGSKASCCSMYHICHHVRAFRNMSRLSSALSSSASQGEGPRGAGHHCPPFHPSTSVINQHLVSIALSCR